MICRLPVGPEPVPQRLGKLLIGLSFTDNYLNMDNEKAFLSHRSEYYELFPSP